MKSPSAKDALDQAIQRAGERHRGLNKELLRLGSLRQTELLIGNRNALPVQVLPAGSPSSAPSGAAGANANGRANASGQSADGKPLFFDGYSAAAGTPEATADGTGRGGTSKRGLVALGQSVGLGAGTLAVLTPCAALGTCVCKCNAQLVATSSLAAAGKAVTRAFGDFGTPGANLGIMRCVCKGVGGVQVLVSVASASHAVVKATPGIVMRPPLGAAGNTVAKATPGMTRLAPAASASHAVCKGTATLAPLALLLAASGKAAAKGVIIGSGFGAAGFVPGG